MLMSDVSFREKSKDVKVRTVSQTPNSLLNHDREQQVSKQRLPTLSTKAMEHVMLYNVLG